MGIEQEPVLQTGDESGEAPPSGFLFKLKRKLRGEGSVDRTVDSPDKDRRRLLGIMGGVLSGSVVPGPVFADLARNIAMLQYLTLDRSQLGILNEYEGNLKPGQIYKLGKMLSDGLSEERVREVGTIMLGGVSNEMENDLIFRYYDVDFEYGPEKNFGLRYSVYQENNDHFEMIEFIPREKKEPLYTIVKKLRRAPEWGQESADGRYGKIEEDDYLLRYEFEDLEDLYKPKIEKHNKSYSNKISKETIDNLFRMWRKTDFTPANNDDFSMLAHIDDPDNKYFEYITEIDGKTYSVNVNKRTAVFYNVGGSGDKRTGFTLDLKKDQSKYFSGFGDMPGNFASSSGSQEDGFRDRAELMRKIGAHQEKIQQMGGADNLETY